MFEGERRRPASSMRSIWVSASDGAAVAIGLSGSGMPQPLSADLRDCRENAYQSRVLVVPAGGWTIVLDSRPSDALALAVRAGCAIFVEERLFARTGSEDRPIESCGGIR